MSIHIDHGDIHLLDLRTRMPFKYGIATMTSTPHAFVRLVVEVAGRPSVGIAADHLPPKWFTKDPARPIADEVADMLRVIDHAVQSAAGIHADSPFDAWRQVDAAQSAWGRSQSLPPLLTQFGTSLVERAMIEAVCRATGQPFARLLRTDAFGMRLGDIHRALAGRTPADLLPERPLNRIIARHTVGLADLLTDADIAPDERLDDGLPQSLVACIRTYGLRHFKIKVSGTLDRDRERLDRIGRILSEYAPADYAFSLDGNEQFHAVADFRTFWDELCRAAELERFFEHLLFVEQPLHRDVALQPEVAGMLNDWPGRPPLIIDESDAELDNLPRALALGYAGTSHKNCKGVFKSIANACLLAQRSREEPARRFIMSGEDLANIGPVALLQDLAVCASLGIESVERNGHHYFAGLSMFPAEVQRQVLEAHGDLYHPSRDGWPTLTVRAGVLQTDSVVESPFGVSPVIRVEQFTPLKR
jgi:hypothetical protein